MSKRMKKRQMTMATNNKYQVCFTMLGNKKEYHAFFAKTKEEALMNAYNWSKNAFCKDDGLLDFHIIDVS